MYTATTCNLVSLFLSWGGGGGRLRSILKEMGPFSASSEWLEWINFHSKWVSYWPGPVGF